MIGNLAEYFKPNYEIFLDKIKYNRIETANAFIKKEIFLTCQDNINAGLSENEIRIILSRTLVFNPEGIFSLTVSFGATLSFSDKKDEYDWSKINIAEEFKENGDFIIAQLMSRISLLIGQITSSYGQQPLILPPNIGNKF